MFAKTIIDSDAFLDMPISSQCLYFHLAMRADDDGFINNPKKIQRTVSCSEDDLTLLIAKKFIIPFQSGIVVIKHWKIHNYIQKDRYKATVYQEEKNMLGTKPNGSYKLLDTQCIQNGYSLEAQVRLGKDSLGKDRIEIPSELNWNEYQASETPNETPVENQWKTSETPVERNKNVKNVKNVKNKDNKEFVPPTIEEINSYIAEKELNVDGHRFLNYFTESGWIDSNGKEVRNWKLKILTWDGYKQRMVKNGTSQQHSTKAANTSKWGELKGIIRL